MPKAEHYIKLEESRTSAVALLLPLLKAGMIKSKCSEAFTYLTDGGHVNRIPVLAQHHHCPPGRKLLLLQHSGPVPITLASGLIQPLITRVNGLHHLPAKTLRRTAKPPSGRASTSPGHSGGLRGHSLLTRRPSRRTGFRSHDTTCSEVPVRHWRGG